MVTVLRKFYANNMNYYSRCYIIKMYLVLFHDQDTKHCIFLPKNTQSKALNDDWTAIHNSLFKQMIVELQRSSFFLLSLTKCLNYYIMSMIATLQKRGL